MFQNLKKGSGNFWKRFGTVVNSGSSANLVALKYGFAKGSEVITPACTFPTTLAQFY